MSKYFNKGLIANLKSSICNLKYFFIDLIPICLMQIDLLLNERRTNKIYYFNLIYNRNFIRNIDSPYGKINKTVLKIILLYH